MCVSGTQDLERPGPSALRALAHPLRLRLLDVLRRRGPSMVSELADAVGESASSTSYHLGQLHQHGYLQARPDLARNGRERWWEAKPESAWTGRSGEEPRTAASPETFLAGMQAAEVQTFLGLPADHWEAAWQEAATIGSYRLHLTPSQLSAFHADFLTLYKRYRSSPPPALSEGDAASAEDVALVFNAFPESR